MMRMSAECKWSRLAPQLGRWHWSGYKLVFVEMPTLLHDFWFARLSDVTRYSALLSHWAYLVWAKMHASPRMIGFLDGTWREVCKPLLDVLQRELAVQPLSQGARSQVPSAIDVVTVCLSGEVGDALKRRRPPRPALALPSSQRGRKLFVRLDRCVDPDTRPSSIARPPSPSRPSDSTNSQPFPAKLSNLHAFQDKLVATPRVWDLALRVWRRLLGGGARLRRR